MDKSEDLSKNDWNIQNIQKKKGKVDEITEHKTHTHTHSNGQFPLASRLSHCPLTQHSS